MMTLSQLTELLGWAAVINISVLFFATIILVSMNSTIKKLHGKMFGISEADLSIIYFNYLANYKILTLIFSVSPYLALKLMGQ